jgi:LacI family transcriptional regulator
MYDVAREARVSVKTVSRVVNNDPSVGQDYVDRVLEVVLRLGFRRNEVAYSLRAGSKTATIGLMIGDLSNSFYAQIARELEQIARVHGTFLVTSSSEEDPTRERDLVMALCQRRVDGLIVVPTDSDHSYCRAEIDMGTPIVFLDRRPPAVRADTVVIDNERGALAGTELLLGRGHRRIAVIGHSEQTATMRERVAAIRGAAKTADITLDDNLIRLGARKPDEAAAEVARLLDSADPPTAFFGCNNLMTSGIVHELSRRGTPVDVVGFDDIPFADFFPQPVDLITYDIEQLARRVGELLFSRIRGDRSEPKDVVIATRLVTRGGLWAARGSTTA